MSKMYKYAAGLLLTGAMCLSVISANAQRRGAGVGYSSWGYPNPGFQLGAMPLGFYPFYYGTSLFYYTGGAFYSPNDIGGYTVATPPVGAAIPELPKNAHGILINGEQFYEYRGVYYAAKVNDKGETVYMVAGRDGVLNTTNNAVAALPKVGDVVNKLPDGSRKVALNNITYFAAPDGVYYEALIKDGTTAYRVASIPSDDDYK
jgi:hypothetical protein